MQIMQTILQLDDPTAIARALERIETASSKLGLHISWAKTKVQNIGAGPKIPDLAAEGQSVESVEQFVYLGSAISFTDGSHSEQFRRTGIASRIMNSLERIWSQAGLSLSTKLRLYTSLVLPVLLYASETWTVNKADLEHYRRFVCVTTGVSY